MNIDLLVPTRGRPKRVEEFLDSILLSAKDLPKLSVSLYLDDNDPTKEETTKICEGYLSLLHIRIIVGPRTTLSECWNTLWSMSCSDIFMHCGDDIIFESPHWDSRVRDIFESSKDKILFVYGDDSIQGPRLGTHSFTSREATEILGYFVPPYFKANHNDTWLNNIYKAIGKRVYCPDMKIKHNHYCRNKSLMDQTYRDGISKRKEARDIWRTKRQERLEDAKKLANHLGISLLENPE